MICVITQGNGEHERLTFGPDELDRSLVERFATVAARWPERVAIASASASVTYRELADRSRALAAAIEDRSDARERPVAILLSDTSSTITGILGAWTAGRLCVPLDASLPSARLEAILGQADPALVVTDEAGHRQLPRHGAARLLVDSPGGTVNGRHPAPDVTGDTLACLLFTSGSTGEPKGIVRSHRTILHRARCAIQSLDIGPEDRVSALQSPAFGAGLRDVMAALLSGASVRPFDLRRRGPEELAAWIDRDAITVLCAVVTTLRHFVTSLDGTSRLPSVRIVRLGSEPLYGHDVDRLRRCFRPDCVFIAGYGASEASGIVEFRIDPHTLVPAGRVPAGYPLEGVALRVLDEHGADARPGEAGEIAVQSHYLSNGYWRRPDLTRTVFVEGAADDRPRTYLTGDLGRLQPDGCLEIIGRRDHQVKVHGNLVHPAEIETALGAHRSVREGVVLAHTDAGGDVRLIAYVVAEGSAPGVPELRRHLRDRLPSHMIPPAFVFLESMPVTANGKIDRSALPWPGEAGMAARAASAPLMSPIEHQIAEVWEQIFGRAPLDANDDFFDLGGDSLQAVAFTARMEKRWGWTLSPSLLFEASTIAGVADALARQRGAVTERVAALRTTGTRAPFFFLHGDYNGAGLYSQGLARHMSLDRPFYAVHPHGLDGGPIPPTIEAMATDLLGVIRALRPTGPYALGGHCVGGLIALEMARQLERKGERVSAVVMIDTRTPAVELQTLPRAKEVVRRAIDLARRLIRPAVATVQAGVPRRQHVYRAAVWRYVPPRYGGRVVLFRAEHYLPHRPDLGWGKLLPRVDVGIVPGDHLTCITRHVAALGAHVEDALGRALTATETLRH